MTITLQAVNELIASLESAGEPSIREQKFLKLAKAYQQLAAENAGLKAGIAEEIEVINRGGQAYCVTPATDRIVAGIKADGVEDMANLFFKLAKDEANSLIAEQWRESGRVANEQAKQLREGADK
ncbi:MAG: hypothetical protein E6078_11010 [Klebsiella pneumoniae]|nr:hypothetical protein [Klebsiella pneumoniae]